MLKILFFLLLLINGGLYAFQHGYLDDWMPTNHEPARIKQQLNADKLQLLSAPKARLGTAINTELKAEAVAGTDDRQVVKPAGAEANAALDKTVNAVELALASSPQINTQGSAGTNVAACTEIGNFDAAEAKRFEKRLAASSLKEKISRRAIPESSRHIVYIPPQESRAAAEKKAGELKNLGINDFFIIQDDSSLQWGISLGVFKTADAARKHLADLNKKGVRSARISDRGSNTRVAFQLTAPNANAQAELKKIKADFPRQEIRSCAAAE
jgi:hypothetical protein